MRLEFDTGKSLRRSVELVLRHLSQGIFYRGGGSAAKVPMLDVVPDDGEDFGFGMGDGVVKPPPLPTASPHTHFFTPLQLALMMHFTKDGTDPLPSVDEDLATFLLVRTLPCSGSYGTHCPGHTCGRAAL